MAGEGDGGSHVTVVLGLLRKDKNEEQLANVVMKPSAFGGLSFAVLAV